MICKIDLSPIPKGTHDSIPWYDEYSVIQHLSQERITTTELHGLNRINIFIGQNNSGKSRMLRKLYAQETYRYFEDKYLEEVIQEVTASLKMTLELFNANDYNPDESFNTQLRLLSEPHDILTFLSEVHSIDPIDKLRAFSDYLCGLTRLPVHLHPSLKTRKKPDEILIEVIAIGHKIKGALDKAQPRKYLQGRYNRIYIPILRGLRSIPSNSTNDSYLERIYEDHFKLLKPQYSQTKENIHTGLAIYDNVKDLLLGTREERDRVKRFENFISEKFYDGKEISLIPNNRKKVLCIGIGRDTEVELFNLGDGVQALITILYPIFFADKARRTMVFIEEPENSLHPGYQRMLIEALMDKQFSHCQFFLTTHSNHFLDISLDTDYISVFTFYKKDYDYEHPRFEIEVTSKADMKVLDLIGVRNSSVFLSNCTIWVEGITDRLYIRKYLELYQENLQKKNEVEQSIPVYLEDIHYAFVEYSGGNITHWQFDDKAEKEEIKATRICNKIFLVADKDSTDEQQSGKKALRINNLKNVLRDNFHVLSCREIENSLHPRIIEKTVAMIEGKAVSEIIKNEIDDVEFCNEKMGKLIENKFSVTKKYAAESGTIENKVKFSKTAISFLETYDELSDSAKKLVAEIYKFIKKSNLNLNF